MHKMKKQNKILSTRTADRTDLGKLEEKMSQKKRNNAEN